MPLCDIDDGLQLRIIGILFLLSAYYVGWMERYEGFTIAKENNFHQYDGPAALDSVNSNYNFSVLVTIFYLFLVIYIVSVLALPPGNKLIPRLKISVYKVYFPMSFCLDLLVLILIIESSNSAEYSSIVPFVNIASIYSCYHSEGSFILKYVVRKLTELFIRYRLTRIVLYAVFLTIHSVLFVFAWKIIGTWCFEYVWHFVDPNNFMTFEYCDNSNKFSQIERTENTSNETFHTESLKKYLLSGSNTKSYSLHYERNFTVANYNSQLPFVHEKHERTIHEDTVFTCSYEFNCTDCLNKREPTVWSKEGSLFLKASEKYKIITTYSDIENSTWTQSYSTFTLYDIKQSDYGEYRCLFRQWSKQYNVLNIQSSVVGRYHLVPREHKVSFVHVPLGNSIGVQWCHLHIIHKSENVEHTHFVDGRSITGSHKNTGKECSLLPYFYHLISFYTGWINIPHPSKSDVQSFKILSELDFIAIWLNTCANLNVYGRHNISLIREIYNSTVKRMQLVEIDHPTQKIILPKAPYMYNYDNKTPSDNTYDLNRALVGCTDSDSLVLMIRIIVEALMFVALLVFVSCGICIGWCIYRRLIISPVRNWILCDVKHPTEEKKKFKVLIFCSETDSPYWDSKNIEMIECTTDAEVLSIHRDIEHFAGRTVFELYAEVFKQINAVIIHLTQSFIEDNECLHFHMYTPLTLVKEGRLPPENILLIHGDTCSLPDSINYTIPDVVIHDWIQSTDTEDRMQKIKNWINIVKSHKCIKDNPNRCCVSSFIL